MITHHGSGNENISGFRVWETITVREWGQSTVKGMRTVSAKSSVVDRPKNGSDR